MIAASCPGVCTLGGGVLVGYGFHPFVINRSSPTPLMMFTVKKRGEPYGIAVTASHNPAIYNGIKVFTAGGRDADETVTARIEAEIAQVTPADVKSVDYDEALAGGLITEANPMNEYLDSILSAVDVEAIKNAALRIGFDPMYGVSWSWYPDPWFFLNQLFSTDMLGSMGNGMHFSHEEVDDLLAQANAVTDQDERAKYYSDALKAIVGYDPVIVYASELVNTGLTSDVQGYVQRADNKAIICNSEVNISLAQ